MKKPHRMGFQFIVVGGLEKPFYNRLRELRQKYDLSDKGLVECMIRLTLEFDDPGNWDGPYYTGGIRQFSQIVNEYNVTAPSDMAPLPEVVGVLSETAAE